MAPTTATVRGTMALETQIVTGGGKMGMRATAAMSPRAMIVWQQTIVIVVAAVAVAARVAAAIAAVAAAVAAVAAVVMVPPPLPQFFRARVSWPPTASDPRASILAYLVLLTAIKRRRNLSALAITDFARLEQSSGAQWAAGLPRTRQGIRRFTTPLGVVMGLMCVLC